MFPSIIAAVLILCSLSEGSTAFDVALAWQSVGVLRRLEAAAPFTGFMEVKEIALGGLGSCWESRWVTIVHRISGPSTPAGQQGVVRTLMRCFETAGTATSCLMARSDKTQCIICMQ